VPTAIVSVTVWTTVSITDTPTLQSFDDAYDALWTNLVREG
jgi:hypothetical protein